jgi:hypothetical protein
MERLSKSKQDARKDTKALRKEYFRWFLHQVGGLDEHLNELFKNEEGVVLG